MSDLFDELTDNKDAIQTARKLSDNLQENYFDLGCLFYHIKNDDLYKTFDGKRYYSDEHTKWKQFVDDNFSVGYRSAQYWLNIYRYFTDMGVSKDRLKNIGWSKAKELVDLTDDTNVLEAAIKVAETRTTAEIKNYVDNIKKSVIKIGADERETVKATKFNFVFYEAAAETVEQILEEVSKTTDGDKNQALFKIMIEWYQSQNEVAVYDVTDPVQYEVA